MNTIGFSSFIDPQCMGIGVSFNELPDNEPQPYEVVVKDSNDWEEIHDYIINENEIDGIPNRKIECISSMNYSSEMSTYQMSNEEANILRNHPKVEYVEKSPLFNPVTLEKRKFYEQFDRYLDVNRFGIDIENKKDGTPGTALTFTQWGLLRHSKSSNPYPTGTASVNEDIQHSLTGKNVDIVIMDNGVRWDHPEFLKPGYTSVPAGVSTASVSRVRDILIHGPEEAGTYNWNDYGIGLVKPGTGSLVGYTTSNVLESSTFNGIWHGSHVAGTAAGNQFGWAFESNIWSIACVDRSDVGFSDPFVGFDYIRVWHKNKPINPETGKKNPTILNGSWATKNFVFLNNLSTNTYYTYNAYFRGKLFTRIQVDSANDVVPALYYANIEELEISGNTWRGFRFPADAGIASRQRLEGLFNDPDCDDIICVFAAGNQRTKMDTIKDGIEGEDYGDNYFDFFTRFLQDVAKSNYYNRLPSPAFVTPIGREDAPIVVASLNNDVNTSIGESRSNFSNIGPGVDIISAGSNVLGVSSTGYQDPRNSSFYIDYLSGTSMAAPQISGVLACYVQSQPKVTRVDARNWIFDQGSIVLPTDTGLFFFFF